MRVLSLTKPSKGGRACSGTLPRSRARTLPRSSAPTTTATSQPADEMDDDDDAFDPDQGDGQGERDAADDDPMAEDKTSAN
jgi:hypothetical protein